MTYKVLITSGKQENKTFCSFGSTPLKDKEKVVAWIKNQPMHRNAKTQIFKGNKRIAVGKKWQFWNVSKF